MSQLSSRTRIILDAALVNRLEALAGAAIRRTPEAAYPLVHKLTSAKFVSGSRLPGNVVTIGSTVTYTDWLAGRKECRCLAWPEDARLSRGKLSILTPIGVALLGLSSGDTTRWCSESGQEGLLTVELVTRDQLPIAVI